MGNRLAEAHGTAGRPARAWPQPLQGQGGGLSHGNNNTTTTRARGPGCVAPYLDNNSPDTTLAAAPQSLSRANRAAVSQSPARRVPALVSDGIQSHICPALRSSPVQTPSTTVKTGAVTHLNFGSLPRSPRQGGAPSAPARAPSR